MTHSQDVLFEEKQGRSQTIGIITLNRPAVLNSLNHDMICAMHAQLKTWAEADHIKAVIIRAADGRAFCAGGDIRLTYERAKTQDSRMTQFFHDEYHLNRSIFHYKKPYIALLDGITMGGGVGISIHGSHRVATEQLLFAMPETGIGFFPDVGGTYFLPRLPGAIGFYLGLTGAKITTDDCVTTSIATHKILRESLSEIIQTLVDEPFVSDAHSAVTHLLHRFSVPVKTSSLIEAKTAIDSCFNQQEVDNILTSARESRHPLCQEAAKMMVKKSPTSLKITLRALQQGNQLDFDACMRQEYRLVTRFLQGHDFIEGIRAVIIDKDQSPRWQPAELEKVTDQQVDAYFAPLKPELV